MPEVSPDRVREFVVQHLTVSLANDGRVLPQMLPDDFDLLLSGVVDSLGLLDLTVALSEFVGQELDFDAMDPDDLTVVGPLCRYVADQVA